MASDQTLKRFEQAKADIRTIRSAPTTNRVRSDAEVSQAFSEAVAVSDKWVRRVDSFIDGLDDTAVLPIVSFIEGIVTIMNPNRAPSGMGMANEIKQALNNLIPNLPSLSVSLLDAQGVFEMPEQLTELKTRAVDSISTTGRQSTEQLSKVASDLQESTKSTADEAAKEYQFAKEPGKSHRR